MFGIIRGGEAISPVDVNLALPYVRLFLYIVTVVTLTPKGALSMEWSTPKHEEIDLNCEVSSYANAEL